jgi:hypothetical protein
MWQGGCAAIFPDGLGPVPFAHLGACDAKGAACQSDADCGSGQQCGFAAGDGCNAVGQCFDAGSCNCNNVCCGGSLACACDGTMASIDCHGFSTKPVDPNGECK